MMPSGLDKINLGRTEEVENAFEQWGANEVLANWDRVRPCAA